MALPVEVSEGDLAALLGVSTRRVRQLVEQGVIKRTAPSKYELAGSVRCLIDHANGGGSALQRERLRKLTADADLVELELAKSRGEVAPITEMEKMWERVLATVRTNMLNVPGRAVLRLLNCGDESEFKRVLKDEIVLVLHEAANSAAELPEEEESDDEDE